MTDDTTGDARPLFSKGERVLCFEPDPAKVKVLWESKVVGVFSERDVFGNITYEYKIHFLGWRKSYDRRLRAEYLLKDNEENRKIQTELNERSIIPSSSSAQKTPKKRAKVDRNVPLVNPDDQPSTSAAARASTATATSMTGRTRETDAGSGRRGVQVEAAGADDNGAHHHIINKTIRFKVLVSQRLREIIDFDNEMILNKNLRHKLPVEMNVIDILEDFVRLTTVELVLGIQHAGLRQRRTAQNNIRMDKENDRVTGSVVLLKEFADGVRIYFKFDFKSLQYEVERVHDKKYLTEEYLKRFVRTIPKKPWEIDMESGNQYRSGIPVRYGSPAYKAELRHYVTVIQNTENSSITNAYAAAQSITIDMHKFLEETFSWKMLPDDDETDEATIFGATHLLRLAIERLPRYLNASPMNDTKLQYWVELYTNFLRYLESHEHYYGKHVYVDKSSDNMKLVNIRKEIPFTHDVNKKRKGLKRRQVDEMKQLSDDVNDLVLEKKLRIDLTELKKKENNQVDNLDLKQTAPEEIAAHDENKEKLEENDQELAVINFAWQLGMKKARVGIKKLPMDENNKLIIPPPRKPSEMKSDAGKENEKKKQEETTLTEVKTANVEVAKASTSTAAAKQNHDTKLRTATNSIDPQSTKDGPTTEIGTKDETVPLTAINSKFRKLQLKPNYIRGPMAAIKPNYAEGSITVMNPNNGMEAIDPKDAKEPSVKINPKKTIELSKSQNPIITNATTTKTIQILTSSVTTKHKKIMDPSIAKNTKGSAESSAKTSDPLAPAQIIDPLVQSIKKDPESFIKHHKKMKASLAYKTTNDSDSFSKSNDQLTPSTKTKDPLATPSTRTKDPLAPSTRTKDPLAPSTRTKDPLAPSTRTKDSLAAPSTRTKDPLAGPSTRTKDPLAFSTKTKDPLASSSKNKDPLASSSKETEGTVTKRHHKGKKRKKNEKREIDTKKAIISTATTNVSKSEKTNKEVVKKHDIITATSGERKEKDITEKGKIIEIKTTSIIETVTVTKINEDHFNDGESDKRGVGNGSPEHKSEIIYLDIKKTIPTPPAKNKDDDDANKEKSPTETNEIVAAIENDDDDITLIIDETSNLIIDESSVQNEIEIKDASIVVTSETNVVEDNNTNADTKSSIMEDKQKVKMSIIEINNPTDGDDAVTNDDPKGIITVETEPETTQSSNKTLMKNIVDEEEVVVTNDSTEETHAEEVAINDSIEETNAAEAAKNDSTEESHAEEVVMKDSTEENHNEEVVMNDSTEIGNEVVINHTTEENAEEEVIMNAEADGEIMDIDVTEEIVVESRTVDHLQQELHELLETGDVAETVEIS